jgi:hypothetical protein
VLKVHPVTGAGALKAFVTVKVGCVEIDDCRVVQQDGQRAWCSLPQVPVRAKADGSGAGWRSIIRITNPDVLARVRSAVLAAWRGGAPADDDQQSRPSGSGEPVASVVASSGRAGGKRDPRQDRIDEMAKAWDCRPPDNLDDL